MWVAKIKVSSERTLIGKAAQQCKIDISGYPVSYNQKRNKIISFVVGELFGDNNKIKEFAKIMKKNKRVAHIEIKSNFMSGLLYDPISVKKFYNPYIIYTKPLFISKDGYEIYNIAAWDRKELTKFIHFLEKRNKGKLLNLKQEKISNIYIRSPFPEMTVKQKEALMLAVQNGYYEYPRNVDVKDLAKKKGVAFSTFQAHLRKAEKKIIDFSMKFK